MPRNPVSCTPVFEMFGHLTDLGVAVPEVERHDLLVDLLLPEHRLIVLQAAVHEAGVVGVESVQMQRRLGESIYFYIRANIFEDQAKYLDAY